MNRIILSVGRKKYRFFICSLLILTTSLTAFAQDQQTRLRLTDQTSREPVSGATFECGNTKGISDESGFIRIGLTESSTLIISHVQYGKQTFTAAQIKQAKKTGLLELTAKSHLLQPVTFLQLHASAGEQESMYFRVEDQLAHDAGQLLEQFSSISGIRKSGAYGFDPVLRGFKYDQINLVIDGVQGATAGCPNRMDPASSQVPLNMIVRAEVLKGPHSLRYGSAFGGTVNFKSADLWFSDQPHLSGRISSSYETNGNIYRAEGVAGFSSKVTDLKLFGSYSTGTDYTDGDGIDIPANFNRRNVGGKLGVKLSGSQNLSVMVANNYASNVDFPSLAMDLRKDNTWLFNLAHAAQFHKRKLTSWHTHLYTTLVDHLMDNLDKVMTPRMVDANTAAKTYNAGGRTELRFDFNLGWLYAGTDMRIENAEGNRDRTMLMGPMTGQTLTDHVWQDALVRKNGLFAEYHYQQSNYHLVFSGRLELNHAEAQNPDTNFKNLYGDLASDLINPSFSAGGTYMLSQSASVGLWLGSAQRSPGLAERYINFFPIGLDPYELVGNPDLKAETNNQADIVFSYKKEKTDINITVYASLLQHYISSEIRSDLQPRMATAPGVRQFVNIDKAVHTGFEFSWTQMFGTHFQQITELAYTYGKNRVTDEALPEIPPMEFRYRLMGSFIQQKLQAEISFRHSFKQDRIAASYGENKTPTFQVIDLKTSYRITPDLSFRTGINNLLNEAYYEHLSRNINGSTRPLYSPGRSFYFSLAFNFP
ncbi:TonB-dependent receptor domain-containing protein [Gaoshiqia sediminis]|uniref:TonB-dependent receptor n=1 Tax=Gaoshiqia sediminis TaxID=2986998 RepID=A0AA42C9Y9_9BACT|nr:TonB-dependent receptor [Gaoshiqia sediminis]MCW0482780.1 TonB-dependent receptor [Gaoshiqia sediminis]